jgi:uncharacterized lipoprotein YddW (UPF0748 family)
VWVATVSNLDVPAGLSPDAGVAFMQALVARTKDTGLNAIFFQVRPESDAWYASPLEPWSRFLAAPQGTNPGWDPLEALLEAAHRRGVEVHAWLNPYRAATNLTAVQAPNHVSQTLAPFVITYNGQKTMNPAEPAVRAHVVAVVGDVLNRYDVDGVHFDDYFYPYPDAANTPFPDDVAFQAAVADGGTLPDGGPLTRSHWRRENVNTLVREVMAEVQANHPHVRFGISPFGIWRPGNPAGVVGLDAYEVIACDALTWLREGSVDYVAPQLYWPTTSVGQPFVPLAQWWAANSNGRHVFAGHGLHRLGSPGWDVNEVRAQVTGARSFRGQGLLGGLHFRDAMLRTDLLGVATMLRTDVYASPALPPPLPRAGALMTPPVPLVTASPGAIVATHPLPSLARAFVLYRQVGASWEVMATEGGASARFQVPAPGRHAVSAVGRGGAESQGAVVDVP